MEHYLALQKIVEIKSFTKAAMALGYTQSSTSQMCAVACHIPTTPNKEQRIIGLFFVPEIYPVKYIDTITLRATKPFILHYLRGSAVLENNNNAFGLPIL